MTWHAIYDSSTGILQEIVENLDGVDMVGRGSTMIDALPDNTTSWEETTRQMVADLTQLREQKKATVDQEAGAFRKLFITDVPGQAQTYEKKEAEARAWVSGDDPATHPFMATEAAVTGQTVEQVRDSIMYQVNALAPLAALIEAHRIKAKRDIDNATDILTVIAASQVDWNALLA